jgi:hypothetical protein
MFVAVLCLLQSVILGGAATPPSAPWKVGTPIVTYWAGPDLTDQAARQMAEGGFNLVWCGEKHLDTAQRHGLRAQLWNPLLTPASLDSSNKLAELKALIDRVRNHPALYSYFIVDEPSAASFPGLGRLVVHLRERDPAHLAYINLFPTYANNEQLGTKGNTVTAYREHLRQFIETVRPGLVSYDHYQFGTNGDSKQYFLNLAIIRRAAQEAGLPFLNIVQACTWTPSMRVPNGDEMRYLVYTTAAYGAQGLSYYVYCHPGHTGGMALADGTPTPIYEAVKTLNRDFVAIAAELQPLRSLAVYHTAMTEAGCEPMAADDLFKIEAQAAARRPRGFLLGMFGREAKPTHALVVNLDYTTEVTATLSGPTKLETFHPGPAAWTPVKKNSVDLRLPPGGGRLVRVSP